MSEKAEELRKLAADYRKQAGATPDPTLKRVLLNLARAYEEAAEKISSKLH